MVATSQQVQTFTTEKKTVAKATRESKPKNKKEASVFKSRNRQAIHLSNTAVDYFQSENVLKAFETLRCALTMSRHTNKSHVNADRSIYGYRFVDCSASYRSSRVQENSNICLNEGTSSLLCFQALKISTPRDPRTLAMLDRLCPCGYAWVIWYNLALVSSFMGTRLGEKGRVLLNQAQVLYEKVQVRIDAEPKLSQEWRHLQISVLNNQACISHELVLPEARDECLDRLSMTLCESMVDLRGKHWDNIFFRYVILTRNTDLAAAA